MKLSPLQIAQLAAQAGFTGDALITAVAIAGAESGGDPQAYNPEPGAAGGTPSGMGSFGLWQIYRKAHAEFAKWDLMDPGQNAAAAYSIWAAGGSFRAWTTFKTGAYQRFMQAAAVAVNQLLTGHAVSAPLPADATVDPGTGEIIPPGTADATTGGGAAGDGSSPWLLIGAAALGLWFLSDWFE